MAKSNIEVRDEFFFKVGLLFRPIKDLLGNPNWKNSIAHTETRYGEEMRILVKELDTYCRKIGIYGSHEQQVLENSLRGSGIHVLQLLRATDSVKALALYEQREADTMRMVRDLPAIDHDTILPNAFPFSAYIRLVSNCRSARTRLQVFDPYLYPAIYHRYLAEVSPKVQVTVVTSDTKSMTVPAKRDPIVAISEIFAAERPDTYELRVTAKTHDRHLRIDDEIYHLGKGLTDAGEHAPYTITAMDPVESNHTFLDDIVTNSIEWVGKTIKAKQHKRVL